MARVSHDTLANSHATYVGYSPPPSPSRLISAGSKNRSSAPWCRKKRPPEQWSKRVQYLTARQPPFPPSPDARRSLIAVASLVALALSCFCATSPPPRQARCRADGVDRVVVGDGQAGDGFLGEQGGLRNGVGIGAMERRRQLVGWGSETFLRLPQLGRRWVLLFCVFGTKIKLSRVSK